MIHPIFLIWTNNSKDILFLNNFILWLSSLLRLGRNWICMQILSFIVQYKLTTGWFCTSISSSAKTRSLTPTRDEYFGEEIPLWFSGINLGVFLRIHQFAKVCGPTILDYKVFLCKNVFTCDFVHSWCSSPLVQCSGYFFVRRNWISVTRRSQ